MIIMIRGSGRKREDGRRGRGKWVVICEYYYLQSLMGLMLKRIFYMMMVD